MKNYCQKLEQGFTLIELLIVIAVIGILSVFVIQSSSGATKSARDAQRKSDISQYRIALENYSIKQNGIHPVSATLIADINPSAVCTTLMNGGYITSCPSDPQNGTTGYTYRYQSDANGIEYILWAKLERCSSGTTCYWYVCANGKSAEKLTTPVVTGDSTGDCGF